jgi:hypothetical protein
VSLVLIERMQLLDVSVVHQFELTKLEVVLHTHVLQLDLMIHLQVFQVVVVLSLEKVKGLLQGVVTGHTKRELGAHLMEHLLVLGDDI